MEKSRQNPMNPEIMKAMKKKERTISIIMATVMSGVMGLLAAFLVRRNMTPEQLAQVPAVGMYISNILESIVVGILLVLIIPFGKIGKALTDRFHAAPPSLKHTLLNCLPVSVGSAVLVSLIVSLINVAQSHAKIPPQVAPPFLSMWFPAWGRLLIPSIVVSYILAVIISPFVVKKVIGAGGPPAGMQKK